MSGLVRARFSSAFTHGYSTLAVALDQYRLSRLFSTLLRHEGVVEISLPVCCQQPLMRLIVHPAVLT